MNGVEAKGALSSATRRTDQPVASLRAEKLGNEVQHGSTTYHFTVLTPTFNREHTLRRLFDSLVAQDFDSFEWLVVDDGSIDGTRDLIESLRRSAAFPVRYIWQENRGKHIAMNRGVREAKGELILTTDSDDALMPGALQRFWKVWEEISEAERPGFAGVTGLCLDPAWEVIGERFRLSPLDSNPQSVLLVDRIKGDKCGFVRRDILLRHPFPESIPTKFIPEGRIWLEIGQQFRTRFLNEPFLIVHDGEHPRLSRVSRLGRTLGDYEYNLYALRILASEFLLRAPLQIFKLAVLLIRAGLSLNRPLSTTIAEAGSGVARIVATAAVPFGIVLYFSDMVRAYGELGILAGLSRRLPRSRLGRRVANGLRRIYVRRPRSIVEVGVLDFRMALEPNECVDGWALFYPQIFDWREIRFLKQFTPGGGVFVDVGANIGFYSLVMSRHVGSGCVVAIEADPYNCAKLRRNIEISTASNVTVFAGGVADERRVLDLRLNTTGNRGGNSFASTEAGETIAVQCLPLSEVLAGRDVATIDSMKLDIEGFEYPVLESFFASTEPTQWPRAIVVEVSPKLGVTPQGDVLRLLGDNGYEIVGRAEHNYMLRLVETDQGSGTEPTTQRSSRV